MSPCVASGTDRHEQPQMHTVCILMGIEVAGGFSLTHFVSNSEPRAGPGVLNAQNLDPACLIISILSTEISKSKT